MSYPSSSKIKSPAKSMKKIEASNSELKKNLNMHRRILSDFKLVTRMKTVTICPKKFITYKLQDNISASRFKKAFKSQRKHSNFIVKTQAGLIDEISPIVPKTFVFKNRLNDSTNIQNDTISNIVRGMEKKKSKTENRL